MDDKIEGRVKIALVRKNPVPHKDAVALWTEYIKQKEALEVLRGELASCRKARAGLPSQHPTKGR